MMSFNLSSETIRPRAAAWFASRAIDLKQNSWENFVSNARHFPFVFLYKPWLDSYPRMAAPRVNFQSCRGYSKIHKKSSPVVFLKKQQAFFPCVAPRSNRFFGILRLPMPSLPLSLYREKPEKASAADMVLCL